jgi:hypothetical protein
MAHISTAQTDAHVIFAQLNGVKSQLATNRVCDWLGRVESYDHDISFFFFVLSFLFPLAGHVKQHIERGQVHTRPCLQPSTYPTIRWAKKLLPPHLGCPWERQPGAEKRGSVLEYREPIVRLPHHHANRTSHITTHTHWAGLQGSRLHLHRCTSNHRGCFFFLFFSFF